MLLIQGLWDTELHMVMGYSLQYLRVKKDT